MKNFLRFLRLFLLPFSWIYGIITAIRNYFYDKGYFKSLKIPGKSICVGNLSTGGTGKSPHTAYLAEEFLSDFDVSILSRGYGRKTKGLREVIFGDMADDVGDEPLMLKSRFGDKVRVVVAEDRQEGVGYIQNNTANKETLIILDDAFQHRKVKAGFSILLSDYNAPFYNDFVLPAGNLREWKSGKKRADCIIITKCPEIIASEEKKRITERLNTDKPVFFSRTVYSGIVAFGQKEEDKIENVLLVTGIARPEPLEIELRKKYNVSTMHYRDHHNFSREDIAKILRKFDTFASHEKAIITTEKDYVRLKSVLTKEELINIPWYYQAISIKIDRDKEFKTLIKAYVDTI